MTFNLHFQKKAPKPGYINSLNLLVSVLFQLCDLLNLTHKLNWDNPNIKLSDDLGNAACGKGLIIHYVLYALFPVLYQL